MKKGLKVVDCLRKPKTYVYDYQKVSSAIKELKSHKISEKILYFYVLDEFGTLCGLISTRDLLLGSGDVLIKDIMQKNIITLSIDQTMEEAMKIMQKTRLLALPVVDHRGKFLGLIDILNYFDEKIDVNNSKKRNYVFQLLGFFLEDGKSKSTLNKYAIRMPWIFCNMLGGIACAIISHFYEAVLIKEIVLAMFIPLVLSLSESISMQAMTQSLQEIGKHFSFWRHSIRYVLGEAKLFLLLALTSSIVIGILSIFWEGGMDASFVIFLGIFISILASSILGSLVPHALHRASLNPKVASGPLVLMLADVITTGIYLSLGNWFIL